MSHNRIRVRAILTDTTKFVQIEAEGDGAVGAAAAFAELMASLAREAPKPVELTYETSPKRPRRCR